MTNWWVSHRRPILMMAVVVWVSSGVTSETGWGERRQSVSTIVSGLAVELDVLTPRIHKAEEFEARAVFTNKSSTELKLNALLLDIPNVHLKVKDSHGLPIHPGPPGMPRQDDGKAGRKILKPGQSVSFEYTGFAYFGTELAPGRYEVRFVYENTITEHGDWTGSIQTEWVPFDVIRDRAA